MVVDQFMVGVLSDPKLKYEKIKNKLLYQVAPDVRFANEYFDMYLDKIQNVFNLSVHRVKNKPIKDIINYIIQSKKKSMIQKVYR